MKLLAGNVFVSLLHVFWGIFRGGRGERERAQFVETIINKLSYWKRHHQRKALSPFYSFSNFIQNSYSIAQKPIFLKIIKDILLVSLRTDFLRRSKILNESEMKIMNSNKFTNCLFSQPKCARRHLYIKSGQPQFGLGAIKSFLVIAGEYCKNT